MGLCEKYKAGCFIDIKGQDFNIEKLKYFIKNFPQKKAIILHGPPGTGKTSLAYALALELKSEILELNASDLRNKEKINQIIGEASQQSSLFAKNKILLIDEVDGVNSDDRGGLTELIRLIEITNFPMIITANKIWDSKFSELRKKAELVELKELGYRTIFEIIKDIAKKEGMSVQEDLLLNIAIKARGDVRAAINDLQTIGLETKNEDIHERDKEEKIFNVLKIILQNKPNSETINLYDKVDMPLDEILLWLEENIPAEYRGEEIYNAFDKISRADVFRGRIHRQQHWRFLIYQNLLLSAGIAASKKSVKTGFVSYKRPTRILKIWMKNQAQKYRKTIAEKYAEYCHISIKRAMKDFPMIKLLLKNTKAIEELKLEPEEIDYLKKG
ncbi:replication factor C large subunit [Candidatus Pacearchaeota archaeon]|nr:replication factor C large subunit [Candidatus Pacearchaeota archaeon]